MNSADCAASRGDGCISSITSAMRIWRVEAVVAQRGALGVETPRRVGDAALDRHREVAAVRGQPVAEHLGRLVRPLQGARDHRPAAGAARGDVLGRHDDRGRTHQHRLAQVLHETDLARVDVGAAMNAGFVAVTSWTSSTKRASRVVGALVERVLADHVRRREQEQVRLGVARVRRRRPRA